MKNYFIPAFMAICLILVAASCKTKKYASLEESEGRNLTFTHGGGFAGTYTSYSLLDNGQLFYNQGRKMKYNEVEMVDHDMSTQIFSNYDLLGFKNLQMDNPGNMTYSITLSESDYKHRIIWTEYDEGTEHLQKFFDTSVRLMTPKSVQATDKNFKIK